MFLVCEQQEIAFSPPTRNCVFPLADWEKISHDQVCIVDLLRLCSKKGPARSNYLLYIPIVISFITIWSFGIMHQALSTYWPYWIFFSFWKEKSVFPHWNARKLTGKLKDIFPFSNWRQKCHNLCFEDFPFTASQFKSSANLNLSSYPRHIVTNAF